MASDEEEPSRLSAAEDAPSATSSGSDDDSGEEDEQIESLVKGRERRATAGNRLSTLLEKEADDDLELLFAEQDDDIEFEGEGEDDQSDVVFGSSDDDDEDKGPAAEGGNEELTGERELEREARSSKKRKATQSYFKPAATRKKVKIDPTTTTTTTTTFARPAGSDADLAKPAKKKTILRPSFADDGHVRQSTRGLTVQNKVVTTARLQEHEEKRKQQVATMAAAAAKRKEEAPIKTLTQADRLAEAERVEKQNSKSLYRWEETEKKRSEEQKARLAALQNRHLEGPVITWWSGLARWVGGKLAHVGKVSQVEEEEPKEDEPSRDPPQPKSFVEVHLGVAEATEEEKQEALPADALVQPPDRPPDQDPHESREKATKEPPPASSIPPTSPSDFLEGIHFYASLPEPASQERESNPDPPTASAVPTSTEGHPPAIPQPSESLVEHLAPGLPECFPADPPKPTTERAARNVVILEHFDPIAVTDTDVQRRILLKRYTSKAFRPIRSQCAITSQTPARFRDPSTGLTYANAHAYHEIQKLKHGGSVWSDLLGCWVGSSAVAARGVPERFYRLQKASKEEGSRPKERERREEAEEGDARRDVPKKARRESGLEKRAGAGAGREKPAPTPTVPQRRGTGRGQGWRKGQGKAGTRVR